MALPVRRSLQHLRDEVRARCGFGTQVATAAQTGLFADFVREAESETYWEFDFRELLTETDFSTVADQVLYDWPDAVDPARAINVQVLYQDVWLPVRPRGIDWHHDTFAEQDQANFPLRYDDGPQIELWPKPDAVYTVRIEHYTRRPRQLYDPSAWVANTAYAAGDFVVPATGVIAWPTPLPATAHLSHFVYECTTAGTSHASTEPTWPTTDGGTVTDGGTLVWTARLNTVVVPHELVARLARYKAKLHYRQPDAEEAMGSFKALLSNMRKGQHVDRRYVQPLGRRRRRRGYADGAPWIPPERV